VCSTHKDKVEIKCMGSIGGKTPTEPKLYLFLLDTLNKMKLMLCALFNYNMDGRIRRLNINVTFNYIWLKWLSFLTHGTVVYLCIMYQSLHNYDYHLPEIRCALLAHLVKIMGSRKWC
jgi:hypothetical protein